MRALPTTAVQRARPLLDTRWPLLFVVAGIIAWIGWRDGGYGLQVRSGLALVVWWGLVLALAFGVFPLVRPPREAYLAMLLLGGFGVWTLLSVVWAPSAEAAYAEFDRVVLYLGVFVLATVASVRRTLSTWLAGLALGITAIATIALLNRCFPDLFSQRGFTLFFGSFGRLSFPVGYWNGVGILCALALPLLLAFAAGARGVAAGASVAPIPALAAVVYLTSSRGAVATAIAGALTLFAFGTRRWAIAGAAVVSAAASIAAVQEVRSHSAIVDGPFTSAAIGGAGHTVGLAILVACIGAGIVWGGLSLLHVAVPRAIGAVLVATAAALAIGAGIAAHPVGKLEAFKAVPSSGGSQSGGFVQSHLLSSNGSGRWQFWSTAIDEWQGHPFRGGGGGSYEAWWAQHGSLAMFVTDAHSLWLETLAELGIVGFLLLVAVFALVVATAIRRIGRTSHDERLLLAAGLAVVVAYVVAAGVDWMWELTVVSVVAFATAGLLVGGASLPLEGLRRTRRPPRRRVAPTIAVLAVGWALVCAEAVPLLASVELGRSRTAAASGDLETARDAANAARSVEPWASSPYLQLALVSERSGQLENAAVWIGRAIERDERDWRLRIVAARVETKLGHPIRARRQLLAAVRLNPRSPLFAGIDAG